MDTMTPLLKLSGFLAALVVVFFLALMVGNAVGPLHDPMPRHGTQHHGTGR